MNVILIIILAYILNIFIGRYLNIKMLKLGYRILPKMWFIPLVCIVAQIIILIEENNNIDFNFGNRFVNWFLLKNK